MTASHRVELGGLPLIVRVAGLPADTMEPFSGDLRSHLQEIECLEARAADLRAALVEALFERIAGSSPERRRFLLGVKRNAFNGRSLERYAGSADWGLLEGEVPSAAEALAAEREIAARRRAFAEAHRQERDRQRRHLIRFVASPELLRGMSLSSLVLVENLRRLADRPPHQWGRRERRLEETLLRYLSRTALKLSPFSSLTRVGLGLVPEEERCAGLWIADPGASRESSLLGLRRYLLDQWTDLLAICPPFRETLHVCVNDTTERLPDGLFRCLRSGSWEYLPESRRLKYRNPALVKVRLSGPLIDWLLERASDPPRPCGDLMAEIRSEFPRDDFDDLQRTVDRLLEIGILRFVPPWASDALHLEREMLAHLPSLNGAAAHLEPFVRGLRELMLLLDDGFRESPSGAIAEGTKRVEELVRTLGSVSGVGPEVDFGGTGHYFQEDVFLASEGSGSDSGELVRLPLESTESLLRDIDPLARLSNLDSSRHDFLHTFAAFGHERWGEAEVGFLDVFEATHGLFQEYVRFERAARSSGPLNAPPFNPSGLDSVERIAGWRREVSSSLDELLVTDGGDVRLDRDALCARLDEIPPPYAASRDFCAFVQPLDERGEHWVLNALFEGAGRMSSRYTAVMEEPLRSAWTSHFADRSSYTSEGEPVELVDLFCPAGHGLNVHAPQTRRVLEIPGESSGLPPERKLRLRDLRVRLRGRDEIPWMVDPEGRRILPVHLGGLVFRYMPNLLKFLTMFGPGEFRYCLRRRRGSPGDGLRERVDRHWVGHALYRRRSWVTDLPALRAAVDGSSEAAAFLSIDGWRRAHGIPEQAFLVEPLATGVARPQTKPQYVDFSSPLFVQLFRSILEMDMPALTLFEALPGPAQMPRTAGGRRWAMELQLDSFGFPAFVAGEPSACVGGPPSTAHAGQT